MAKDTKSRILESALELFSKNGYAGTNIRELSASQGLGKSSLYRHFESKEEVWNSILDEMEAYYDEKFGSSKNPPAIPQTAEEFKKIVLQMFSFTIHDKKIVMCRKILLTEQFRDENVCRLATKHFNFALENIFSEYFEEMMKNGLLKKGNSEMLAFAFTAPITSLVHLCDREPEMEAYAVTKAEKFVDYFINENFA
ncbi:MAG: TetR/AcrR family transcriptional regulator [Ruminococcus sp.]|nr:TetR/AcrR family transcriptional regulator [Candidatus Copronaster equi]